MTSQPAPSQPFRALALIGAALAGWAAARLPATIEGHGNTLAALSVPQPAKPATVAATAAAAPPPQIYVQPIYLPAQTIAAAAPPPPQIIHIHHHTTTTAPASEFASLPVPSAPAPLPAPGPATVSPPPPPEAGLLAQAAYDRLRAGQKREALRLFEAALIADPTSADPRRSQWQREAATLKRRWSLSAFSLLRDSPIDPSSGLATGPLLGSSQSGAALGYTVNPLARRPITLTARLNAATDARGRTDPRTAQAAVGIRYQALPALAISAERLVSLGEQSRDDWLVRLSSGIARQRRLAGLNVNLDAYGEASLLGNGDSLAAGQARALTPLFNQKSVSVAAGIGSWGSVQNTGTTSGRLDVGPSAAFRVQQGRLGLELSADYRQRIAGNALPASGPTVTLSSSF